MSLVELRQAPRSEAVSGGNMDKVVERKRIDKRIRVHSVSGPDSIAAIGEFLG